MSDVVAAKRALRRHLLAARAARPAADRNQVAEQIADAAWRAPELREASRIACYVSLGDEPGTAPLLARLLASGRSVLVPVLLADDDLDWARYYGPDDLVPGRRGMREPSGPRLGREAIGTVEAVLVPGLAVSPTGTRLGRGGGSYDRALARVPAGVPTAVVLHDDELDLEVPAEPHDRPVTAALSPTGLHRRVPVSRGD